MIEPARNRNTLSAALALCAIALGVASCSERVLLKDVPAAEARRCAIVLQARDIRVRIEKEADSTNDGQTLTVVGDDADYHTAVRILDAHALPKPRTDGFATESASLIPSPLEERARFMKGLSGEIESLIENVDGIASAEVLVSVPERRVFSDDGGDTASASAVIAYLGEAPPLTQDEVRSLVAQSVGSSIEAASVTVVFRPAIRPGLPAPVVRFERDRIVESGFLAAVGLMAVLETLTLWRLRSGRRSSKAATE